MTSTEFAAKYRLLKNVATRGARTFLAQQVELGRMVMVHYLDADGQSTAAETIRRLRALRSPARDKVLEIVDVDGSAVAVTLFISSFSDFAGWLDQVGGLAPAEDTATETNALSPTTRTGREGGDFPHTFAQTTLPPLAGRQPVSAQPPASPPPASFVPSSTPTAPPPTRLGAAAPRSASEFTGIFGKSDADRSTPPATGDALENEHAPNTQPELPSFADVDSPTLIMEPVRPARSSPPPSSLPDERGIAPPVAQNADTSDSSTRRDSPASQRPPSDDAAGFTAIFGKLNSPQPAASMWQAPVTRAAEVTPPEVIPPQPALADVERPLSPPPMAAPAGPAPAGEFTQLFQRLDPSTPNGARAAELSRPLPPPALADLSATPVRAEPPASMPLPSAPPPLSFAPPPIGARANDAPAPAPSTLPNAPSWDMPAFGNGNSGPSEFTRIMGRVALPLPAPPAAAVPPVSAGPTPAASGARTYLPLVAGLTITLVATVGIVLYFVLRR